MEAAISCKFHCRRLAGYWRGWWSSADLVRMAADIEERLAAATAAWSLENLDPLDGGAVAFTCAALRDGHPVVLKLNPRGHRDDAQLGAEGDALAFWRPTGAAVELLDRRDYAEAAGMDPGRARECTRIRARAELSESGGWPGLRRLADALG
jgi:hypothetical protein